MTSQAFPLSCWERSPLSGWAVACASAIFTIWSVYDDGIDIEHHRPPETFADWKQHPVLEFANFSPCCVPLDDGKEARRIAETKNWCIFPVVDSKGK
jgi:hypothetical protein